jgi:hypothetical protein
MMPENSCPVCGYQMEAPPKNYRICPSCGTEFGVNDVNASVAELRDAWIGTGPKWWSTTDASPPDWNGLEQMEKAGISVRRPPASEPVSVSTSSTTSTVAGSRGWQGWSAASPAPLDGKLPGAVFH